MIPQEAAEDDIYDTLQFRDLREMYEDDLDEMKKLNKSSAKSMEPEIDENQFFAYKLKV